MLRGLSHAGAWGQYVTVHSDNKYKQVCATTEHEKMWCALGVVSTRNDPCPCGNLFCIYPAGHNIDTETWINDDHTNTRKARLGTVGWRPMKWNAAIVCAIEDLEQRQSGDLSSVSEDMIRQSLVAHIASLPPLSRGDRT